MLLYTVHNENWGGEGGVLESQRNVKYFSDNLQNFAFCGFYI